MIRIPALMLSMSAIVIAGNVSAQTNYPEKPIRMVVGFPPGSLADTVARLLGQKLAEGLGKPIVVDNAAGAAGNIAIERRKGGAGWLHAGTTYQDADRSQSQPVPVGL